MKDFDSRDLNELPQGSTLRTSRHQNSRLRIVRWTVREIISTLSSASRKEMELMRTAAVPFPVNHHSRYGCEGELGSPEPPEEISSISPFTRYVGRKMPKSVEN